jgi:hypothetical protein
MASDYAGFLHSHPHMERARSIDRDHVIVDRKDWLKIRKVTDMSVEVYDRVDRMNNILEGRG